MSVHISTLPLSWPTLKKSCKDCLLLLQHSEFPTFQVLAEKVTRLSFVTSNSTLALWENTKAHWLKRKKRRCANFCNQSQLISIMFVWLSHPTCRALIQAAEADVEGDRRRRLIESATVKWRWREMESGAYPQALAVWRCYPAGGTVWTSASGRPGMTTHTWRRPKEIH